MDVGAWLRSLGLAQYEGVFRDNEIEAEILPDLSEVDLEKLGLPLGIRNRLLKAIANLVPSAETSSPTAEAAERRQLSVMFCDLVDSTAMSARLDPEDMHAIIGAYHKCCAALISGNGGYVAKYMGDGVLAYFGYPQAHEHDAERAVRAGLAIIEAAPKLETSAGAPLHVRVGIATGIVVVGDLLGSGESQERGIVGGTPNLAARLQGIARPDSVVIAEGTRRLLGDLFELEDLGARELKGVAAPTRAWAALRANPAESRFEALHASGLTALVGREEERELLARLWARARTGEGQVVLVSGEAGIGKSRLTAAFLESLAGETHTRLRYFCSPQHTESALYPIIGNFERLAGLARDDTPEAKLDKLDALLRRTATPSEDAALIAEMLSLPNDGRYPALQLAPQQRRQRTMEALVAQVEALSLQNPVLITFEDAHWSDPSSLEALGRLVEKLQTLRALLFVTFRPGLVSPWIGRPPATALTINRLTPREVGALIDRVAGSKQLPDKIKEDIVERADGIPLFVEEITKAVLEAVSAGAAIQAIPLPSLAVPASLHASLMERLDRLGDAKSVAQTGAAIGREFSYALLASVARETEPELTSALDRLVEAELLFRQSAPPRATYRFKHALVQDAAYGTLLREPRRALHARIAEALQTQFGDVVDSDPERLARHCAQAGLIEQAAHLWGKAGQQSISRSALIEAEAQLTRALALIAALPSTPALRREQIALQVGLASAQMHTKGYGSPDTKASLEQTRVLLERAEALGEAHDDPLMLFLALFGFWIANYVTFDGDRVVALATEFLALAQKQKATIPLMIGHRLMGPSLLLVGEFTQARMHLDLAMGLYDPVQHLPLTTQFGADFGVSILSMRSFASWLLGCPDMARADLDLALQRAREIGHAVTLTNSLIVTFLTHFHCGNYIAAEAQSDEAVALAHEKGAAFWKTLGAMFQGCVLAHTGRASEAVRAIAVTIDAYRSTGSTVWIPFYLLHMATAHADIGRFEEAARYISDAMTAAETTGERWCEAEIHRTAGEITLSSPQPDAAKAQAYFKRALEIARAHDARSWELRAAMSLARLWRDQGRRSEAHDLIAPLYGWFTEGFDTLDLKEAEKLLAELAT
jgi:class 3 adenylate cyclase/predicted ATPase